MVGDYIASRNDTPRDQKSVGKVSIYEETHDGRWERTEGIYGPPGPWNDGAWFSWDVAINGDVIAVGTPKYEVNGTRAGAVYIYEKTDKGWEKTDLLTPEEPKKGMTFGRALDFDGDTLFVGSPRDGPSWTGAAHVYKRGDAGDWNKVDRLLPPIPLRMD